MSESNSAILAALIQAQIMATRVDKTSRNEHQRYDYASSESVMQFATDVLGGQGLAWVCVGWTVADGVVTASYTLIHESGSLGPFSYSMPAIEGKGRPLDKAVSTATTYLQSYSLRGLLNLPRVEPSSEPDRRDDRGHDPSILDQLKSELRKSYRSAQLDQESFESMCVETLGRRRPTTEQDFRSMIDMIGSLPNAPRD